MEDLYCIICCLQVKDAHRISGNNRSTCPYFEEIDAILGTRAASSPAVLLASSANNSSANLDLAKRVVKEAPVVLELMLVGAVVVTFKLKVT